MADVTFQIPTSPRGKQSKRCLSVLAAVLTLNVLSQPASTQGLPDGGALGKSDRLIEAPADDAGSIVETYGDWTLRCATVEAVRSCLIGQVRGDGETGERIFVMELHPPSGGLTNGVLLMPFGLRLPDGVRLMIDGGNLGREVPFESCLPAGCIIRLSLPDIATDAMRKATELSILATFAGDAEPTAFTVPLGGFAAALDRLSRLSD